MNSISWLLYVGHLGDVSGWLGALGFLVFLMACGATIALWVAKSPDAEKDKDAVYAAAIASRVKRITWPLCIILWSVAFFTPSKSTVYAIAAAEVGQQIAKTEIANDAMQALHIWIKKQIEPVKK